MFPGHAAASLGFSRSREVLETRASCSIIKLFQRMLSCSSKGQHGARGTPKSGRTRLGTDPGHSLRAPACRLVCPHCRSRRGCCVAGASPGSLGARLLGNGGDVRGPLTQLIARCASGDVQRPGATEHAQRRQVAHGGAVAATCAAPRRCGLSRRALTQAAHGRGPGQVPASAAPITGKESGPGPRRWCSVQTPASACRATACALCWIHSSGRARGFNRLRRAPSAPR